MTALTAHPDRRPLMWALAGALALHFAALAIPLPRSEVNVPPPPSTPLLELHDYEIPPPPLTPPKTQASPELTTRLPVPFAVPSDLTDPLVEAPPPIDLLESSPQIAYLGLEAPVPPPGPSTYPETYPGLELPHRVAGPEVAYPQIAIRTRQAGRVVLRAVVTETGSVEEIEILSVTRPDLGFSDAAIAAVSEWVYEAGTKDDRPVRVALTVVVEFNLE